MRDCGVYRVEFGYFMWFMVLLFDFVIMVVAVLFGSWLFCFTFEFCCFELLLWVFQSHYVFAALVYSSVATNLLVVLFLCCYGF